MPEEIRPIPLPMFSVGHINAVLDELDMKEPGKTVAFVATAQREDGGELRTRMAVMVNPGGVWSFSCFAEGDVKRPLNDIGAEVRFSL